MATGDQRGLEPRLYQRRATEALEACFRGGKYGLCVSPGGSGKTVIIGDLVARALKRSGQAPSTYGPASVLVVSHRKEIIEQTIRVLGRLGVEDVGVLSGGSFLRPTAPVLVANIASIRRRYRFLKKKVSLLIIDEAHHTGAKSYRTLLDELKPTWVAGFTATPFRLDGKGLGDVFDEMIVAAKPSELLQSGHLAQPIIYRAPERFMPDLSDLRIARGDYVIGALAQRMSTKKIVGNVVANYFRRAQGRKAIVFAVNIEHAKALREQFESAGVPAAHVDGTLGTKEREDALTAFERGDVTVLTNCLVLAEGYDLPSCDAVVLARPTQSLILYLQQVARAMRPSERQPIILDHGRLLQAFGLPEADRDFVLTQSRNPKNKGASAGPVKDCPDCGAVAAARAVSCAVCGHQYAVESIIPDVEEAELSPYDQSERDALEARLLAHAETHGFKPDWVRRLIDIWVGKQVTA